MPYNAPSPFSLINYPENGKNNNGKATTRQETWTTSNLPTPLINGLVQSLAILHDNMEVTLPPSYIERLPPSTLKVSTTSSSSECSAYRRTMWKIPRRQKATAVTGTGTYQPHQPPFQSQQHRDNALILTATVNFFFPSSLCIGSFWSIFFQSLRFQLRANQASPFRYQEKNAKNTSNKVGFVPLAAFHSIDTPYPVYVREEPYQSLLWRAHTDISRLK